jgi:hypothetical protein
VVKDINGWDLMGTTPMEPIPSVVRGFGGGCPTFLKSVLAHGGAGECGDGYGQASVAVVPRSVTSRQGIFLFFAEVEVAVGADECGDGYGQASVAVVPHSVMTFGRNYNPQKKKSKFFSAETHSLPEIQGASISG